MPVQGLFLPKLPECTAASFGHAGGSNSNLTLLQRCGAAALLWCCWHFFIGPKRHSGEPCGDLTTDVLAPRTMLPFQEESRLPVFQKCFPALPCWWKRPPMGNVFPFRPAVSSRSSAILGLEPFGLDDVSGQTSSLLPCLFWAFRPRRKPETGGSSLRSGAILALRLVPGRGGTLRGASPGP